MRKPAENQKVMILVPESRTAVKKLKVFITQGEADTLVTNAETLKFMEAIRGAGVRNLRHEVHSGGGGVSPAGLGLALDWFSVEE